MSALRRTAAAVVGAAAAALLVTAGTGATAPAATAATWRAEPIPSDGVIGLGELVFAADGTGLLTWERIAPKRTALATRAPRVLWTAAAVTALPGITWGNAALLPYGAARTILFAQRRSGTMRFGRAPFRLVTAFGRTDGSFGTVRTIADDVSAPAAAANRRG